MAEYIIHLKIAQKHILAVSVGKQTNEQIDRLTKKKKITIYGETCVIEITVRSRQGFFCRDWGGGPDVVIITVAAIT